MGGFNTVSAGGSPKDINSIMAGWVDRGPWQYWDTTTGAAGAALATSYSLFSVPIGQVDPVTSTVKTKLQTNMQRGNQFPPPRCLVLESIGFYFSSKMLLADISLILDSCYIEFRIDDKIFFEGQLWQFSPGAMVTGHSTKTNESAWGLGLAAPALVRRYGSYSKYIAPLQQFSLNIIFPGTPPTMTASGSGGTGMFLVAFLDGLTDRSVQ